MATTLKKLAKSNPSATTLTDCYTVPASTQAAVSVIVVCNRGADTIYRVSHAAAGAANNDDQYIAYDVVINANETHEIGRGITMAATDVIRVYAGLATLTFTVYGQENS